MTGRKALVFLVLLLGFSLGIQAGIEPTRTSGKASKPSKPFKPGVKRVKQKDGSVVVRLQAMGRHSRNSATVDPSASRIPEEWLDTLTEPRFMTALATVAIEPADHIRTGNGTIDPSAVRNWLEFIDPELYMRWMAAGLDPRFSQAIFNRMSDSSGWPHWTVVPIRISIPASSRAGAPLKPTIWSNAFGDGPSGHEAAQEWLKLPWPEPWSNPWLSDNANFRY
jgi:hypothetical protein